MNNFETILGFVAAFAGGTGFVALVKAFTDKKTVAATADGIGVKNMEIIVTEWRNTLADARIDFERRTKALEERITSLENQNETLQQEKASLETQVYNLRRELSQYKRDHE